MILQKFYANSNALKKLIIWLNKQSTYNKEQLSRADVIGWNSLSKKKKKTTTTTYYTT